MEKKPTDCILYSEDGSRFKIHKVSKDLHYLLTLGMEEDKLTRNFWICRKTKSGDRVSLSYDLTTFYLDSWAEICQIFAWVFWKI